MLDKHKFEIIQIKPLKNYYSIQYWLKMFPMNSQISNIVNRALSNSKFGEKQIGIKAGNFVAMARKK
jgi:hypothetical protein